MIVSFSDRVDPRLFELTDRSQRDTRLVKALKEKAAATQGAHRIFLQNQGARQFRELWVINGIAVTVRAFVVRQLASRPGIESIRLDSILQAPVTSHRQRGAAGMEPERGACAGTVVAGLYRQRRRRRQHGYRGRPAHPDLATQMARRQQQLVRPARRARHPL